MRKLRLLFVIPFVLLLQIIVVTKTYFRHKRSRDVDMVNVYAVMSDYAKPILEKYGKHDIPFSLTVWLLLYLLIK
jgi:hypothetical protein